jgi:hypothetical protein
MRPEFVDYLRTAFGVTQQFFFHGDEFHNQSHRTFSAAISTPASAALDDEPRSVDPGVLRTQCDQPRGIS